MTLRASLLQIISIKGAELTRYQYSQISFLNIQQGLPSVEAFANEGIKILLNAQALKMGGEVGHPSVCEMTLMARCQQLVMPFNQDKIGLTQW